MADSKGDGVAEHAVTRRDLLKLAGAAVGAVSVTGFIASRAAASSAPAPAETAPPWNHDPASPIGPNHWDTIGYPVCGTGTAESPINIDTTTVVRLHSAPLTVDYSTSELTIENTGHVAEVTIPAGFTDTVQIGNDTYQLTQYHFHAPGEHEVNGRLADVEGHFVHQNSHGDTAVVAVFFRRGAQPNRLLDKILFSAPVTAGEEVTIGEANPARLFPGGFRRSKLDVGSFYTYNGSLTTPGCSEGVRWFVLADGGHVSPAAVRRFHYVISRFPNYGGYDNNNRPVVPLNGRVVGFRCAA